MMLLELQHLSIDSKEQQPNNFLIKDLPRPVNKYAKLRPTPVQTCKGICKTKVNILQARSTITLSWAKIQFGLASNFYTRIFSIKISLWPVVEK